MFLFNTIKNIIVSFGPFFGPPSITLFFNCEILFDLFWHVILFLRSPRFLLNFCRVFFFFQIFLLFSFIPVSCLVLHLSFCCSFPHLLPLYSDSVLPCLCVAASVLFCVLVCLCLPCRILVFLLPVFLFPFVLFPVLFLFFSHCLCLYLVSVNFHFGIYYFWFTLFSWNSWTCDSYLTSKPCSIFFITDHFWFLMNWIMIIEHWS